MYPPIAAELVSISAMVGIHRNGRTTAASRRPSGASLDNVRNSNNYDFPADVIVKTIPLPTVGNIGRFSKTDSLYLEGSNSPRKSAICKWQCGAAALEAWPIAQCLSGAQDGEYQTRWRWRMANKPRTQSPCNHEGDFQPFSIWRRMQRRQPPPTSPSTLYGGTVTGEESVSGQQAARSKLSPPWDSG
ncbi:MAG: hypothetical protein U0175_35725 [Caldilineaceae bacterium]